MRKDREIAFYFREWLLEETLAILSTCLSAEEPDQRIRKKSRHGVFQQAVRMIDDQLREPLSTKTLAAQLDSSPRVLQYAFHENLGITPLQYILTRKLHAARSELKNSFSGAQTRVSDIATLYNMSNFGRFSMQYKKLFREPPSATVKRTNSIC